MNSLRDEPSMQKINLDVERPDFDIDGGNSYVVTAIGLVYDGGQRLLTYDRTLKEPKILVNLPEAEIRTDDGEDFVTRLAERHSLSGTGNVIPGMAIVSPAIGPDEKPRLFVPVAFKLDTRSKKQFKMPEKLVGHEPVLRSTAEILNELDEQNRISGKAGTMRRSIVAFAVERFVHYIN